MGVACPFSWLNEENCSFSYATRHSKRGLKFGLWKTTAPPRCINLKIGGFSFSETLRPRVPPQAGVAGLNIWLLRDLSGNGKVLGCR